MVIKKITAGILALSLLSGAAFAAEQATTTGEQDLLAIASAGALTGASAGVYQLNAAEMDEVHGGKWRLKIKATLNPPKLKIWIQKD